MRIRRSKELPFLNNNIEIPVGDELTLNCLTFFIPIQIKKINKLDYKLNCINDGYQRKFFKNIYKSIDKSYKSFRLNPSSWNHILHVPFEKEDTAFQDLLINIYRGAQDYVVLQYTLTTSERLKYEFWSKIREEYYGTETIYKDHKSYQTDYQNQELGLNEYINGIEKRGKRLVLSFFEDLLDFKSDYHIPCVRIFSFRENNLSIHNNRYFWENIGLLGHKTSTFSTKVSSYYLIQNYESNTIGLFADLNKLKLNKMYGYLENEIYEVLNMQVLPYLGPGLVLSEIFNYLFVSYRKFEIQLDKNKHIKILKEYNNLLYLIEKYTIDIIDDPLLSTDNLSFYRIIKKSNKLGSEYHKILKDIISEKQKVLLKIYKRERNHIDTNVNFKIVRNNYILQIFVATVSIIALFVAILK